MRLCRDPARTASPSPVALLLAEGDEPPQHVTGHAGTLPATAAACPWLQQSRGVGGLVGSQPRALGSCHRTGSDTSLQHTARVAVGLPPQDAYINH